MGNYRGETIVCAVSGGADSMALLWGLYLLKDKLDISLSAAEREIGGLGIFITKKTMDTVSYAYENGKNILTMTKKI